MADGLFWFYAVWLFGSYEVVKKSCEEREHMPMMEHTDAMGVMMFISIPTVLSAFVFFIIYVFLHAFSEPIVALQTLGIVISISITLAMFLAMFPIRLLKAYAYLIKLINWGKGLIKIIKPDF